MTMRFFKMFLKLILKTNALFMSDQVYRYIYGKRYIITFCAVQTYFIASRRECINFYRNTTASSLSQPETLDEHRRFPARVVNDASSFNFRYAAFFGDEALSVLRVTVSFWEFSQFISVHDLVFISVARVTGFRRVASPESRRCLTSFHEKLANAPVLSSSL